MPENNDALRVSIIIVTHNSRDLLGGCLDAALAQDLPADSYETIVVDNGSTDSGPDMIRESYPTVRLLCLERNDGFAAGNNRGAQQARGAWLAFLNPDTQVEPDWLRRLLEAAESRPNAIAAHAGQQFDWDDARKTHSGDSRMPDLCRWGFVRYHPVNRRTAPYPTLFASGATLLLRRSWVERHGGPFDTTFFMYEEDKDLSLQLNAAGHLILATPQAVLAHHQTNVLLDMRRGWRNARQAVYNGWRAYLKNLYLGEFLLYAPILCAGAFLKPWEFPAPLCRRLLAGMGLFFLSLVSLPAALWYYVRHADQRRETLQRRTRPWGWFLAQIWQRGRSLSL